MRYFRQDIAIFHWLLVVNDKICEITTVSLVSEKKKKENIKAEIDDFKTYNSFSSPLPCSRGFSKKRHQSDSKVPPGNVVSGLR